MSTTRDVYVLADFRAADGTEHERGAVITVAYETVHQRKEVNAMVYRGFLTLDVASAQKHAQADDRSKRAAAKKAGRKST